MQTPSQTEMQNALGISQAYASMILSGKREPSRSLAIAAFRRFGWRHSVLDGLTDEQIDVLEGVEPWTPRVQGQAA